MTAPKRGHNSRGRTIVADCSGSSCFDDLRFKDGTVYATFTDGTQYEYDMDKSEAQDWFDDDLGGYFNAMVR
jgi:hypothetical protein